MCGCVPLAVCRLLYNSSLFSIIFSLYLWNLFPVLYCRGRFPAIISLSVKPSLCYTIMLKAIFSWCCSTLSAVWTTSPQTCASASVAIDTCYRSFTVQWVTLLASKKDAGQGTPLELVQLPLQLVVIVPK